MQCPMCGDQPLYASMTQQGVEVDYCQQCHGVWLDKGEIFSFTKRPKELARALQAAQISAKASSRLSPKTGQPMQELVFLDGKLVLDVCPETEGIWFDEGEIEHLVTADPKLLSLRLEPTLKPLEEQPIHVREIPTTLPLFRLPNLTFRTVVAIILIHLPLIVLIALVAGISGLPVSGAVILGGLVVFGQWISCPRGMNTLIHRFFPVQWLLPEQLPEHLQLFVIQVCAAYNISPPLFGILADSRPNAFTYGASPRQARIILTRGLLDQLSEAEQRAVVAHELGLARHWSIGVLTVGICVPWIFSLLACGVQERLRRTKTCSFVLSVLAVVLSWLACANFWSVHWLSKGRQLLADRFAGTAAGNPNHLISAGVTIAYGLAGQPATAQAVEQRLDQHLQRLPLIEVFDALGIMSIEMAKAFVIAAQNAGKPLNVSESSLPVNMVGALKWELWNPWARYYERQSMHSLFTKRLRYLINHTETLGLEPALRFSPQKPETYWNEFLVDLTVMYVPDAVLVLFGVIALLTRQQALAGLGLILTGILIMVRFFFTYPTELFPLMTVSSLFKHTKVSGIRPVPCTLKGKVVRYGVSGALSGDDMALRDYTGITFLEYRQPSRVWEFLFRVLRVNEHLDQEVTLEGWYRRTPIPYIEIKSISTSETTRYCHAYTLRKFLPLCVILLGFVLAFVPLEALL